MPTEPVVKRTYVFVDGQNLFYAAKKVFGRSYPDYDPVALATRVCVTQGFDLRRVFFYTGAPAPADNPFWNHFWTAKLGVLGTRGVVTFSRPLRYRTQTVALPGGGTTTVRVGQEKGIDVRLALDVVRNALLKSYDVALIFSQDQDLSKVADDLKTISSQQGRWIKTVCAFPASAAVAGRGINHTHWVRIDQATYDACLDPTDYRPTKP